MMKKEDDEDGKRVDKKRGERACGAKLGQSVGLWKLVEGRSYSVFSPSESAGQVSVDNSLEGNSPSA